MQFQMKDIVKLLSLVCILFCSEFQLFVVIGSLTTKAAHSSSLEGSTWFFFVARSSLFKLVSEKNIHQSFN